MTYNPNIASSYQPYKEDLTLVKMVKWLKNSKSQFYCFFVYSSFLKIPSFSGPVGTHSLAVSQSSPCRTPDKRWVKMFYFFTLHRHFHSHLFSPCPVHTESSEFSSINS